MSTHPGLEGLGFGGGAGWLAGVDGLHQVAGGLKHAKLLCLGVGWGGGGERSDREEGRRLVHGGVSVCRQGGRQSRQSRAGAECAD